MNINLANIDFIPGQGGGGSLTPDEQKALDTLVDSSEGVLNTVFVKSEGKTKQNQKPSFTSSEWNKYLYDVDGEIYCKSDSSLFKYNPETLSFDFLFRSSQYTDAPLWKDNSGILYEGVSHQIDIENKTVTSIELGGQYQYYGNSDNIYKGKYGIYILTDSSAYKFNERTQKFIGFYEYTTDYTDTLFNGDIKEYDGHIIIVKNGSFYELVETEYSITITSVDPYFNTTLPSGNSFNSSGFYKVGDNYYYFYNDDRFRLVNNEWIKLAGYYYFDQDIQLVSSNGLFILKNNGNTLNSFILYNPGTSDYKKTIWNKISDVAVDLLSDQDIYGYKKFNVVHIETLKTNNIYDDSNNDIYIRTGQKGQTNIVLRKKGDIELNCDKLLKNNKIIPTIDDIIVNKTITYPGKFINEVPPSPSAKSVYDNVWTTPSGRLFVRNTEWDFSTSNWIRRRFNTVITNTRSRIFTTSFGLTYITSKKYGQIYVWNDSSSNWDLKYENPDNINITSDPSYYWVYGGDLYYSINKKFDPNNLEWVSGEYSTNFSPIFSMCNLGNDVYIRNGRCEIQKYNSSTKTFDQIGHNIGFCNGYLFKYNNDLYINNDEDVYKYNTSTDKFDKVNNIGVFNSSDQNIYFELDGKLYTVKDEKVGYLYDLNINTPEVPASDGTYTLKAVRAGDQITYNWVLDA